MARLGDLQRSVLPLARVDPASPAGWQEREVSWVRLLTSRVPALDALSPGDLAIVPVPALTAVAERGVDVATVADELAHGGAVAAVVVDRDGEQTPEYEVFQARATAAGVPVLLAANGDPVALERTVIGYLVNARAELERQAASLESDLERIALAGGGADALSAAISAFLGRAVAIEGGDGEPLAVHVPRNVPAAAAAAAGYLANRRRVTHRTNLPPGAADADRAGALALLGEPPVGELDRIVASRVSGLLALELTRARSGDETGRELPADGPPWVVLVARQVRADAPATVEQRERLRERLRRLAPARQLGLRGTPASLELRAVAAVPADDRDGALLAGRMAALLSRPVALSRPFATPEERPAAEADARETLHAWEHLASADPAIGDADGAAVVRADRLPVLRLLGGLHNLPDGQRQARALLAPLLRGPGGAREERLRTLRALLDAPGPVEAAARLGVHRNTIAYRIARIESVTGWRLDDADLRLALSLAVRLVQRDQGE